MKRVAIVQARMSSSRFPGKSLKLLAGRPVIWHVSHRLAHCASIDEVVLATSVDDTDTPLAEYAREQGVRVVRGPLDNVLQRYVMAAEESGADVIVRVTGDAPLIDPRTVDGLVDLLVARDADYASLDPEFLTIHNGFEPFSARALARVVETAGDDPANIEHVTPMMKRRPDLFDIVYLPSDEDVRIEGVRTSVDTPADLAFLETVYEKTGAQAGEIDVRDIVRLLRAEPELMEINSHVRQKTAFERTNMVLFRCDGGSEVGMGHVRRCLALAAEFTERQSWGVRFALHGDESAAALISAAGYGVERLPGVSADRELLDVCDRLAPTAVVFDTRSDISARAVHDLHGRNIVTALLDDGSDRRLTADLAFYPPVPQVEELDWSNARGDRLVGWEWIVLGAEFSTPPVRIEGATPSILVTMGGADPTNSTPAVVAALAQLAESFDVNVVIGPASTTDPSLLDERGHAVNVLRNVSDMATLMAATTLAVASFGVTAYELAASGVPTVLYGLTDDHLRSARVFENAGMAVVLGMLEDLTAEELGQTVSSLLADPDRRALMSKAASAAVDGHGARRIVERIVQQAARTSDTTAG